VTRFEATLLAVGRSEIPGPELFWMSDWDAWYPLVFQVVLLRDAGVTVLVNTGPGPDLRALNDRWSAVLGERAVLHRSPGELLADQLARQGVSPEDVTHVILTPLQLYTVGNVLAFPAAQICLARRGWIQFHTTHAHPHDDRASSIPDDILVHLVTDVWPRVRLLGDEEEILPGLRAWWCGGHHRASMVVEADTDAGTAAISDCYFYLDNVERNHPIGITENIAEALAAYQRVRDTADIVLPLYDPANFDRYPGGRVK